METREILQDIIGDFAPDKFTRFFREKNRSFAPRQESFTHAYPVKDWLDTFGRDALEELVLDVNQSRLLRV